MKMRIFTMSLLALCLALFTMGGAMAQTSTTGSIEGTVTDPQGGAVPNATVTVSGPNLIRPQTATTDDQGRYTVLNLPPGRYSVVVAATAGFAETTKNDIEVNLSRTSSADVQVSIAGQSATVTVTDVAGAAVDVTNNTSGSNVSTEQFSNFPTQRTVQSLYSIAPTVTRSGLRDASGRDRDPSVAGSSGPENNYILDGVNTTDPAFGGSGANLPFEFVQEVEIKTGAYGAEYGRATGGIFNVITKSGGNEFRGDVFGYFTTKGMVRSVKSTALPFTGAAPTGFSEIDAGFDIGGPIAKDKLWFFGAFNPQRRENFFSTQTFHLPVENKVTTPFYAGKLTYAINNSNTLTFSTFGDFTKQEGFLFRVNARVPDNGFGTDVHQFQGVIETGGHNYALRLNSTITPTMIGEFMGGLHFQRANTIPDAAVAGQSLIQDNLAIQRGGAILTPTDTNVQASNGLFIAFVDGRGGTLERNFTRAGFGLVSDQQRNRFELAARLQNIYGRHTIKYGFEFNENRYKILTTSSGGPRNFGDPFGEETGAAFPSTTMPGGVRITNGFGICTAVGTQAQCPVAVYTTRLQQLITAGVGPAGITTAITDPTLTAARLLANPILVLNRARVRDFFLNTGDDFTSTRVESFYIQDDFKLSKNVQFNFGLRWDYQQAYGTDSTYLKLNNFKDNLQPRVGLIWDFTGQGRGKLFVNFARYLETPIPLDINVRAGGDDIQLDRNINASRLNAPVGSVIIAGTASGLGCLGCEATPIDPDLKPQTVNEVTAGFEYEIARDLAIGARGIYRAQGSVIEDGSFDDGEHYFLFNPGESLTDRLAESTIGTRFGRARRYYRAMEFTATKRFTNNYQFIASYVFSSLIGNYEGLFRNDNGQSDPNITSLFDLPDLLNNTYGRLPNDRPHQFKFNGSYRTPFKLMVSGNFYVQSGQPFNALIPHPVYGDNEGFEVPRGTAINPVTGKTRTPTTFQLDLGAYYPIRMGENRELRFQVDWFNVTNAQRAIRQDETLRLGSGIPGIPAGSALQRALEVPNPFYGTGLVFQFPSTLRLGAKFSF
ncbi:MAG TPA: TonB-dependent receptor [Pyrinomonadaceae bacterium]|nr:TonB-dependent receptor [Pyrinomonadaceae bacterium]